MWTMAKKKNKDVKTVLKGFKDFGGDTMSRLATTVKVDMPAVAGAAARKPATALARLFGMSPEQKAARKLDNIRREMDLKAMPSRKRRRSRLPLVIAMLVAMVAGGAYWLYDAITLPRVPVAQYLDYHRWLDTVSGNVKPSKKRLAGSYRGEWQPSEKARPVLKKHVESVQRKVAKKKQRPEPRLAKSVKPKKGKALARLENKKPSSRSKRASYGKASKPQVYKRLGE
jgi:hypothetical protein